MLLLASQSPRRAELLQQMGIAFHTLPINLDETRFTHEPPQDYVRRLACAKSALGWQNSAQDMPVLGADTIVAIGQAVLGKPQDQADAQRMLSLLSDNTHYVYTGLAITTDTGQVHCVVSTEVKFGPLSAQQISDYWHSGEPVDKAGSYAIQGIGGQFVQSIKGSYSAVVGLPLFETRQLLNKIGYKP
ncbi:MAG: Maf family nucleotide pyrophosphatase [Paraglaciecola sp.]|uniref:Maf family protein n=1 Tax=Paraglaciecola sp. TaxID=1920173 RepID=UPI002772B52D|nr:Maf family nucleotide pyrophosphatase [Paraglaciecola sp.]MDP5131599.1 Maf family nucleotide pyrophosphatase [Paraglaciecola sp.]